MIVDFSRFVNETVEWGRLMYVFDPVLRLLKPPDVKNIVRLLAQVAVNTGAYETKQQYLDELDATPSILDEVADFLSIELQESTADDLGPHAEAIRQIFEPRVQDPKVRAGLLSYRSLLDVQVQAISDQIVALERKWKNIPAYAGRLADVQMSFQFIEGKARPALHNLLGLLGADTRWHLVPSEYRLYVPPWQSAFAFADPIEAIIRESATNPSAVFRLTSREFEKFLRRIFEAFGYDVQLTAATRDGGADLLCLTQTVGDIPVKLAIEAKRYARNRPITVSLVRQFVGANVHLKANKLVYITTSRYTREATRYANSPDLVGLLELKELPDIMRWAAEFVEAQYRVGV